MSWFDFLDDLFGTGSGGGQAKAWSIGLTEYTKRVPIIGPYYGALLTGGYEDLSELTSSGDFDKKSRGEGWETDADGIPRKQSGNQFDQLYLGPDDGGHDPRRRELLRHPDLLADNDVIVRGPDGRDYIVEYRIGGEGGQSSETWTPMEEVVIHGTRPDRSGRGSAMGNVPRAPDGGMLIEQYAARRPEREAAPTPESQAPSRPELFQSDPQDFIGPLPNQTASEVIISVEPELERRAKEQRWQQYQDRLRRMGRIELSDLGQFGRGLFNGVINAGQEAVRLSKMRLPIGGPGVIGTLLLDQTDPIKDSIIDGLGGFKLETDPVFGGGAIIGEHLSTNLVFEALPFLPELAPLMRRAGAATKNVALASALSLLTTGLPGGTSLRAASILSRSGNRAGRTARGTVRISELGRVGEITTRRAFRRYVLAMIRQEGHPLRKLINPRTGKFWRSTEKGLTSFDWFNNPAMWEAGHFRSAKYLEGTADTFVIMSAHENRLASAMIEHPRFGGAMLESGLAVSIGGLPVDLRTAEALVDAGVISSEAFEAAPFVLFETPPITIY